MLRITTSFSYGGRRCHVAVNRSKRGWMLQIANPTEFGYRFDPPFAGPFKTKKEAQAEKRRLNGKGGGR